MKIIEQTIKCPTCNGTGHFSVLLQFPSDPTKIATEKLIVKVRELKNEGLTLRQIGKKVGIKNAGLVDYYLKKSK